MRFLDDGRIEIDSNTVERSMRTIALNRKNALFAGSDQGAEHWAMLASLIETCKLHSVNPEAYLTDVLTRLVNGWPNKRSPNSRLGAGCRTVIAPSSRSRVATVHRLHYGSGCSRKNRTISVVASGPCGRV